MSPRKTRQLAEKIIPRDALAREIGRIIGARGLSQAAAARLVEDDPAQICKLLAGQLDGFSAERLVRMLTRLGVSVDIVLREVSAPPGTVTVRRR